MTLDNIEICLPCKSNDEQQFSTFNNSFNINFYDTSNSDNQVLWSHLKFTFVL